VKSTSKKGSQKSSRKKQSRPVQKRPAAANKLARLEHQVETLQRELAEAQLRENVTSDILRAIASSPTDIHPLLDAIAEKAAKLCHAEDAAIFRVDGNLFRSAAHFGPVPMVTGVGEGRILDRGFVPGRALIDKQTVHVPDLRAAVAEFPRVKAYGIAMGLRTVLSTPLLREGEAIGAIHGRSPTV
jgi:GAF domain